MEKMSRKASSKKEKYEQRLKMQDLNRKYLNSEFSKEVKNELNKEKQEL